MKRKKPRKPVYAWVIGKIDEHVINSFEPKYHNYQSMLKKQPALKIIPGLDDLFDNPKVKTIFIMLIEGRKMKTAGNFNVVTEKIAFETFKQMALEEGIMMGDSIAHQEVTEESKRALKLL